jgi:transcriptional regulator with XRE-family HTH domain
MVDIATFLHACRVDAGLTQRELAARAGTSPAAVCHYERGSRVPRADTVVRLVAATDATLRWDAHRGPEDAEVRQALEDNGEVLAAVLDLAEHLPRRRRPERLVAPVFAVLAAGR